MVPCDPLWGHLGAPRRPKTNKNKWVFNVFAFHIFDLPGLLWTRLGPSWRSLGSLLAPLGSPWAPPGVPLEPSGGSMGGSWRPPNPSWILLGSILGALFASSSSYGASMTHFGARRPHFGPILEPIWCISVAIWRRFGSVLWAKRRIHTL